MHILNFWLFEFALCIILLCNITAMIIIIIIIVIIMIYVMSTILTIRGLCNLPR